MRLTPFLLRNGFDEVRTTSNDFDMVWASPVGVSYTEPYCALPQRILGIRANPRPIGVSRHSLDHNGEGFAL